MSVLKIPYYSELDVKLEDLWQLYQGDNPTWTDFIKDLDKNIIDVEVIDHGESSATSISFNKEEHITWFLIRMS